MSTAYPLSIGGINYNELHEGSGVLTQGSQQNAVRRLICAWSDAIRLCILLRGWTQTTSNIWTPGLPALHPFGLGLYCTDTVLKPMGKPVAESTWEKGVITATYQPLLPNTTSIGAGGTPYDLLDESLDFSADYASMGKSGWTYDDDSSAVQETVQVLVPQIAYTITQYHVTKLPTVNIFTSMACVNQSDFRGAGAGYVLYLGASATRKIVGTFNSVTYLDWTINHKFLVGSRNLLQETNPTTGTDTGITGPGGRKKFDSIDFGLLGLGN